jgi:hypothetical protein
MPRFKTQVVTLPEIEGEHILRAFKTRLPPIEVWLLIIYPYLM